MSIRVMNLVWENAPYQENTLLTLLALADWSSEAGVSWPSMETLAKKSRQSVRNAQRTIKRLEKDGVLSIQYRKDNSSLYTINLSKIALRQNVTTPLTGDTGNIEGVTLEAENVSQMSPNTSIEPSVEPSTPSDSVPSSVESSKKTPDPRHSPFVKKHSELYCLKNHCAPAEVPWGPRDAALLSKVLKEHPGWSSSFLERILTHKFQSKKGLADPPTLWMGSMIRYLTGPLDEYGTVLARQAEAPRATDDLADAIRQRGGPDALKLRHRERNSLP